MNGLFLIPQLRDPKNREKNKDKIRSLCHNAFLGHQESLCRVLGRFLMYVDTNDMGFASHMLMNGFWEMHITEAMASILKPGMTVVDAGANFGYYSLLMASMIGPKGHLYAVEPNPRTANFLKKTLSINGFKERSTVVEAALSDKDNLEVSFKIPKNEPKNAHILRKGEVAETFNTDLFEVITVATKRLDSVINDKQKIDFIKIDVEGAEHMLWHGMKNILQNNQDIIILLEVNSQRYADSEIFYNEIADNGFILRAVDNENGIIEVERDYLLAKKGDSMLYLSRWKNLNRN
ncbi:MAG: FkbM family methyltransferase [Candidatus Nitrosoglobus sp.]|jgi:FkbM family methyltransferase